MVKLSFVEKDPAKRQKKIEDFCKNIYDHRDIDRIQEINDYILNNPYNEQYIVDPLILERPSYEAEIREMPYLYLMSAGLDTLKTIKKSMDDGLFTAMDDAMKKYIIKTIYGSVDHKDFIELFDSRVCPYCNRNYIGYRRVKVIYELDHFFSKDEYPLLAACFYNLVPSCGSCNRIKSTQEYTYSPYEDIDVDRELKITYIPTSSHYLHNASDIDVIMKIAGTAANPSPLQGNIDALHLEEIYKMHSDTVQELLWKKMVYSSSYAADLSKLTGLGTDDIKRMVTGAYCDPDNYGKRPLSKLTSDISRQIGLI